MSQKGCSKDELEASILRDSFFQFVVRFWDSIVPEDLVLNWHMEYLCDELQLIAERVFRGETKAYDLIINIPPGTTKSTICSIMFPAWVWTRMPSARCICGSFNERLSLKLSLSTRDIVQSDKWIRLFGDIKLRQDMNTKGLFQNEHGGFRLAVGTGGSITGYHGHFLIVDDPLDPEKALSEAELKTSNRWMCETLPTRKVDKLITPTILIMQRLHQNDPSANMVDRGEKDGVNVKHICLPAEIDQETRKRVKPPGLVRRYKNGLLDENRLSRAILQEMKVILGPYGYAGQFDQWPVPLSGGMFKADRIIIDQAPSKFIKVVRYWDKAGTRDGGAYTAGVKMGLSYDKSFWVLNVVRGQWDATQRENIIKQTAKTDGKRVVVWIEQEPGSSGKESAQSTIRNLAGFSTFADRPTGDKQTRAYPFSAQVNSENVRMVEADWNAEWVEELRFFPDSRYKDQVDACSGAFSKLTIIKVGGL